MSCSDTRKYYYSRGCSAKLPIVSIREIYRCLIFCVVCFFPIILSILFFFSSSVFSSSYVSVFCYSLFPRSFSSFHIVPSPSATRHFISSFTELSCFPVSVQLKSRKKTTVTERKIHVIFIPNRFHVLCEISVFNDQKN